MSYSAESIVSASYYYWFVDYLAPNSMPGSGCAVANNIGIVPIIRELFSCLSFESNFSYYCFGGTVLLNSGSHSC
jgi:hypothetical protein